MLRFIFILLFFNGYVSFSQLETHIRKKAEITGRISPKSIITNNNGLFAAQNMIYRHSVTIYNSSGELLATVKDEVNLEEYGYKKYTHPAKGGPVEGVFADSGKTIWVSNYAMHSADFKNTGCDHCHGDSYDPSFIYKINTDSFSIENVIKVGAVPKFMAISKGESFLLVANWTSGNISYIDLNKEQETKKVFVGRHPRGIAITKDNEQAYIALMGSNKLACIQLSDFSVSYTPPIGKAPRSLILADNDSTLYISLNNENKIVKYNLFNSQQASCFTGSGPRSMTLSPNEKYLYVVNYFDDSFSKIQTDSMKLKCTVATANKPIGITANWANSEIWVACYSGKIEIFKDFNLAASTPGEDWWNLNWMNNYLPSNDSSIIHSSPSHIKLKKHHANISTAPHQFNTKITKSECNLHLVVGVFSVKSNALNKQQDLENLGYNPTILNLNQRFYVSINCFDDKSKAENEKHKVSTSVPNCESVWIMSYP